MEKVETSFEGYKFTPEELEQARKTSFEHRCYLQTILCDAAEEKVRLKYDPYKPLEYVQAEAYLRGQMDILAMLLNDTQVNRPKNAVTVSEPPSKQP